MRTLWLLILCCIVMFKATGQAGSLDHSFGNKGIQTTAFLSHANTFQEHGRVVLTTANGDIFVVVQADNSNYTRIAKYLPGGTQDSSYGNAGYSQIANLDATSAVMQGDMIIVAGYASEITDINEHDFALARYKADGRLDSSFGEHGRVTTDFSNSDDQVFSITLQGNKIIVAGYTYSSINNNSDFALARYSANGVLDPSFGKSGLVTTDFNNFSDVANSMAIQDDKIVVAGYTSDFFSSTSDFALARYTANGTLDSSFGENGKLTTDFNTNSRANAVALQGDKIVVAGYASDNLALARYTTAGALDTSFGKHGKIKTRFSGLKVYANAMTLQADKIIVAGYTYDAVDFNYDFALVRYREDGTLDTSFGTDGIVTTDFDSSEDIVNSITLQGDKILVAGHTLNSISKNYDYALARYMADGKLDASFGKKGLLTGYLSASYTNFTSTAIQGNKIIAAGYTLNDHANNYDFVIARYNNHGMLDTSFGVNGKVTTDFNGSDNQVQAIVLQGNRIIAAGYANNDPNSTFDFGLTGYTADGKPDSSFGENGKVTTDFYGSDEVVTSMALQRDKIIVGGYTIDSLNNSDFALARYTANGMLDTTFGVNGRVVTDLYNTWDEVKSIAILGDKIIVGGYTTNPYDFSTDFVLIRYTANGKLDSSFGVNGVTITDFGGTNDFANSIALQGDKIIAGGYTDYRSNSDFALARYNANGTLDAGFGVNGKVTTDFNGTQDVANTITLQGNNILVGGYTTHPADFISDFALARYTPNGTLDSTFGEHGKVTTDLGGSAAYIQDIVLNESRLYTVGSLYASSGESHGVIAAYQLEASEPEITIADVTVPESKRFAVVNVRLSAPSPKWVRVNYATGNKTAVSSRDYLPVKGVLLFVPGTTITKVYIPIIDDNQCEVTEQLEILLTKAWNATIKDSIGVVTILDDDNALTTKQNTTLRINATPNPSSDAFTIQLQGSNLKQQVSIRVYDISGRLLEEKENISIGQSLHLGDQYKAGTYIIEAVQGTRTVQTKVIKTGK